MNQNTFQTIWLRIQLIFSAIGGTLAFLLGGLDGLLIVLIAFSVMDYLTGVLNAIIQRQLSSAIGFKGICKKVLIYVMVGAANMLDIHLLGGGGALRSAVICFYLSNEGVSMLENAAKIGLPIPEKLRDVLAQLHGSEDEKQ